jgi:hypothetical protein
MEYVEHQKKKNRERYRQETKKKKKQKSLLFLKLPSRGTIKTRTTRRNVSSIMQTLKRI